MTGWRWSQPTNCPVGATPRCDVPRGMEIGMGRCASQALLGAWVCAPLKLSSMIASQTLIKKRFRSACSVWRIESQKPVKIAKKNPVLQYVIYSTDGAPGAWGWMIASQTLIKKGLGGLAAFRETKLLQNPNLGRSIFWRSSLSHDEDALLSCQCTERN